LPVQGRHSTKGLIPKITTGRKQIQKRIFPNQRGLGTGWRPEGEGNIRVFFWKEGAGRLRLSRGQSGDQGRGTKESKNDFEETGSLSSLMIRWQDPIVLKHKKGTRECGSFETFTLQQSKKGGNRRAQKR